MLQASVWLPADCHVLLLPRNTTQAMNRGLFNLQSIGLLDTERGLGSTVPSVT